VRLHLSENRAPVQGGERDKKDRMSLVFEYGSTNLACPDCNKKPFLFEQKGLVIKLQK